MTRETAWIALPEQHPLRDRKQLEFPDLATDGWATCARGSDGHRALVQAARAAGAELEVRHFVADQSTQIALVRAGLAVACIPSTTQPEGDDGVVFRPLATQMHREVLLLASSRAMPRTVEALVDHLTGTEQA